MELKEMILETDKWFSERKKTIENMLELETFILKPEGGDEEINIPEEHIKGVKIGLQLALIAMGEFPIKIEKVKFKDTE